MTDSKKMFLWCLAAGIAATAILRTDTFRRSCARLIAGGLRLKDDVQEYLGPLKEEAEEVKVEQDAKANS